MANFIEEVINEDIANGRTKEVVTRIPPEPNGYLHIGHAKSVYINYYMTAQAYGGKCHLRFDDTNPAKEDDEYVNAIIRDVEWLGWQGEITYASDYFEKTYECAKLIIKKGLAYVDDTPAELMREMRGTLTEAGKESACRNRSVEENLRLFEEMRAGKYADGELVLRAKIDMASPNINMRDPVIYKVLHTPHYRQGNKWCIYPLYDFAHPIQDAIEGITHSLCSLEFENHRPLYEWVVDNLKEFFPNPPKQREFARLNIERTIMSKRYLKRLVDEGKVDGWDDPRMPTICGLRRRGYTPSSILKFVSEAGIAKADSECSPEQLEACIRSELNDTAPRAMAVLSPVRLTITNRPDGWREESETEINPSDPSAGKRKIAVGKHLYIEEGDFAVVPPPKYKRLTPGAYVRLKGSYIVKCTGYETDENGKPHVLCELIEGTAGSDVEGVKAKGVIHWVNADDCVDFEARFYDHLLLPYDGVHEDFADRMNPESLVVYAAKGEKILGEAEKGSSFQFVRTGYFVRDVKSEALVYNRIVGLKDGYKTK